MSDNKSKVIIQHLRSNLLENGVAAKLPNAGSFNDYGIFAVNYNKGNETISTLNSNNEVVAFNYNLSLVKGDNTITNVIYNNIKSAKIITINNNCVVSHRVIDENNNVVLFGVYLNDGVIKHTKVEVSTTNAKLSVGDINIQTEISNLIDEYDKEVVDGIQNDIEALEKSINTILTNINLIDGKILGITEGEGINIEDETNEEGVVVSKKISTNVELKINNVEGKEMIQLLDATDNTKVLAEVDASAFVVDGMLKDATYDETNHTLKLTWNIGDGKEDKTLTVNLSDLIDVYVAGNKSITVEGNAISVNVSSDDKYLTVDGTGLHTKDIDKAIKDATDDLNANKHTHSNYGELEKIKDVDVAKWDSASEKAHTHNNKDVLDKLTQDVIDNKHTHNNKEVVDNITSEKVSNWDDAVSKKHEHSNITTLSGITDEDIINWNKVSGKANASDVYTKEEIEAKGYLTEHQDISGKANVSDVPTKVSQLENDKKYTSVKFYNYKDDEITILDKLVLSADFPALKEGQVYFINDPEKEGIFGQVKGLGTAAYEDSQNLIHFNSSILEVSNVVNYDLIYKESVDFVNIYPNYVRLKQYPNNPQTYTINLKAGQELGYVCWGDMDEMVNWNNRQSIIKTNSNIKLFAIDELIESGESEWRFSVLTENGETIFSKMQGIEGNACLYGVDFANQDKIMISVIDTTHLTTQESLSYLNENKANKTEVDALEEVLAEHITNEELHIQEGERESWNKAKEDIDLFLDANAIKDETINTLKEIQDYISEDAEAAAQMISNINSKVGKEDVMLSLSNLREDFQIFNEQPFVINANKWFCNIESADAASPLNLELYNSIDERIWNVTNENVKVNIQILQPGDMRITKVPYDSGFSIETDYITINIGEPIKFKNPSEMHLNGYWLNYDITNFTTEESIQFLNQTKVNTSDVYKTYQVYTKEEIDSNFTTKKYVDGEITSLNNNIDDVSTTLNQLKGDVNKKSYVWDISVLPIASDETVQASIVKPIIINYLNGVPVYIYDGINITPAVVSSTNDEWVIESVLVNDVMNAYYFSCQYNVLDISDDTEIHLTCSERGSKYRLVIKSELRDLQNEFDGHKIDAINTFATKDDVNNTFATKAEVIENEEVVAKTLYNIKNNLGVNSDGHFLINDNPSQVKSEIEKLIIKDTQIQNELKNLTSKIGLEKNGDFVINKETTNVKNEIEKISENIVKNNVLIKQLENNIIDNEEVISGVIDSIRTVIGLENTNSFIFRDKTTIKDSLDSLYFDLKNFSLINSVDMMNYDFQSFTGRINYVNYRVDSINEAIDFQLPSNLMYNEYHYIIKNNGLYDLTIIFDGITSPIATMLLSGDSIVLSPNSVAEINVAIVEESVNLNNKIAFIRAIV